MEGMGAQLSKGSHCLSRRYMNHMILFVLTVYYDIGSHDSGYSLYIKSPNPVCSIQWSDHVIPLYDIWLHDPVWSHDLVPCVTWYVCSYVYYLVCFLTDLTTYDAAKQAILRNTRMEDNALTHALSRYLGSIILPTIMLLLLLLLLCLSSACSGLVSATLGTPADVVKTRMMNQKYVNGRWWPNMCLPQ